VSLTMILVAATAGSAVAVFAVVWAVVPARAPGILMQRFSESLAVDASKIDVDDPELHRPLSERVFRPFLRALGRLAVRFTPGNQIVQVRQRLAQAGWTMRPETLITLQFGGVPIGLGVGIGLVNLAGFDTPLNVGMPLAMGVLGYMAGPSLLKTSIKRRANLVRIGLPNVLDLLTISMEAGLSFDASMQRVALSDTSLLADEFKKSLNEIRLGKPRADALTAMADRNHVTELTGFVRAVVQAEPLGVSVANVLRIHSEDLRRLRRQRAEQAGHRAPVLMLLPMLGCIFPCVFVMLLGPAVLSVIHSFSGS
jgi:tight adherence protein C